MASSFMGNPKQTEGFSLVLHIGQEGTHLGVLNFFFLFLFFYSGFLFRMFVHGKTKN